MLELHAVNICAPTKEGDYYDIVALNQYPIIILGRVSELKKALASPEIKQYVSTLFRNRNLYDKAMYHIMHCMRDNTDEKFTWRVADYTQINIE